MKKQILFLLLITSIVTVKAQVSKYYPFPTSNAYWGGENESNDGSNLSVNDYGVLLAGDTTVNGKTYHQLYSAGGVTNSGSYTTYVYAGAFREDTVVRKVYMLVKGVDSLWYDFTLKANDSIGIPPQPGSGTSTGRDYVYSVDSIMIFGNYRMRINIANSKPNPKQILCSIIEGIGGTDGPFGIIAPPVPFEAVSYLLCFRQNTDTVQLNHGYFSYNCYEFGPLGVNTISASVQQFTVYPNPAANEVAITYLLQAGQNKVTMQLFNALGQMLTSNTVSNSMGQVNENISELTNGIYYYTLSVNGVIAATSKLVVIH
jgi:hypothetical protein